MIKQILVALDPDQDTQIAIRYSIALAKRFQAHVTGLAVVDVSNIPIHTGSGTLDLEYYGQEIWESLTRETRDVAQDLLDHFRSEARKAGVSHRAIEREGASWERIVYETQFHDLLVIGRDARFFYNEPERDTRTLAKVVKNGVGPTLMVIDEYHDVQTLMVACDGSAASARSIKSFVHLLPYGHDVKIEMVYVQHPKSGGEEDPILQDLERLEEYLQRHSFRNIVREVVKGDDPAQTLLELQIERRPDLLLMGAHSVSALRRVTFGSNTDTLITESKVPIFMAP